jgi:hypothetical protein
MKHVSNLFIVLATVFLVIVAVVALPPSANAAATSKGKSGAMRVMDDAP